MKFGLLIDNNNICYNTINYFIDCIEKALTYWGIRAQKISVLDANVLCQSWDAIIGINNFLPAMKSGSSSFILELLGCPMFNILVDPPYFHHLTLESHANNLYLIVLDEGHAEYCKKYYSPFKGVQAAYLLGSKAEAREYDKREIDVLFTGTYEDTAEIKQNIYNFCHETWADAFFDSLIDIRLEHTELSAFQSMMLLQEQNNIQFPNDTLKLRRMFRLLYAGILPSKITQNFG